MYSNKLIRHVVGGQCSKTQVVFLTLFRRTTFLKIVKKVFQRLLQSTFGCDVEMCLWRFKLFNPGFYLVMTIVIQYPYSIILFDMFRNNLDPIMCASPIIILRNKSFYKINYFCRILKVQNLSLLPSCWFKIILLWQK